MDATTRGQIIRRSRKRRGYSQSVLAGHLGRSESWLSQVERGKRDVDSHAVLTRLAEVPRVSITDLTGGDSPEEADMKYAAAREIERAMMRCTSLETIIEGAGEGLAVDISRLRAEVDRAYAAYQASRYNEAGRHLPRLIQAVEAAARGRGSDRP